MAPDTAEAVINNWIDKSLSIHQQRSPVCRSQTAWTRTTRRAQKNKPRAIILYLVCLFKTGSSWLANATSHSRLGGEATGVHAGAA